MASVENDDGEMLLVGSWNVQSHYGSMGLVYLPTFTIKIKHLYRYIYTIHGSYGNDLFTFWVNTFEYAGNKSCRSIFVGPDLWKRCFPLIFALLLWLPALNRGVTITKHVLCRYEMKIYDDWLWWSVPTTGILSKETNIRCPIDWILWIHY